MRIKGVAGAHLGRDVLALAVCLLALGLPGAGLAAPPKSAPPAKVQPATEPVEYVILLVFEGVGEEALKSGAMPVLNRLAKEGSVTWSAAGVIPPLRLPTMASIITGLPVEKHGVTWNTFEFIRGYPRPPTMFDYLDLSGGKDSAIFYMDESLYQLAKPEPYTDYQMCGSLKPECNTGTVLKYIREYFRKAASKQGYGHAIQELPHLLVVHLPEAAWVGQANGWTSPAYREALRTVDRAVQSILDLYKDLGLLKRTNVFATALSVPGANGAGQAGSAAGAPEPPRLPLIAWGSGIKAGYTIRQPVSIIDIGATVMRTLGLETYTEWESRSVEEIFTGPMQRVTTPPEFPDYDAAHDGRAR